MSPPIATVPDLHAVRQGRMFSEHQIRAWTLRNTLEPWCQRYAVQIVWAGAVQEDALESALWGKAHHAATAAKLWSLESPWFDWWGVARQLWDETLAHNRSVAENLRTEIRRMAFARALGAQMLSAAEDLLQKARIALPGELILEIVRKIAHGTLPGRRRGAVR